MPFACEFGVVAFEAEALVHEPLHSEFCTFAAVAEVPLAGRLAEAFELVARLSGPRLGLLVFVPQLLFAVLDLLGGTRSSCCRSTKLRCWS